MKNVTIGAILVMAAFLTIGGALYWLSGSCRPIDILFSISGCEERIRVVDFDPLNGAAMSSPDTENIASLFGWSATSEGWRPSMVRIDLGEGGEGARYPIRVLNGFNSAAFAQDDAWAIIACGPGAICTEDGNLGAVMRLEDGHIVETLAELDYYPLLFPGDPAPDVGTVSRSTHAWAAISTERIVQLHSDRTVELVDVGSGSIIRLLASDELGARTLRGLSVSQSGAYIASLDRATTNRTARLYVWDSASGERLVDLDLGPSYSLSIAPVWSQADTRLALLSRHGRDTLIDIYRWQDLAIATP